jgi:hypothetical protein
MAYKGMSIPVRTVQGRAVLSEGAQKNAEVIALMMADGDSDNPWNSDVGLEAPLFRTDTRVTRGLVDQRIREHFDRLETDERAKLTDLSVEPTEGVPGELDAHVDYVDIETDDELVADRKIARGGA